MKLFSPEDVKNYFKLHLKPVDFSDGANTASVKGPIYTQDQIESIFSKLVEGQPKLENTVMILKNPRGEPPVELKAEIQFDGKHVRITFKDQVRFRIDEVLMAEVNVG